MLNVAEWKGLAPREIATLPTLVYFHENQFTYPVADGQSIDYHLAFNNILSLLASDASCFNSEFHLKSFRDAASNWLGRMPDFRHSGLFLEKMSQARVCYPGVEAPTPKGDAILSNDTEALKIGWVARWEHDKRPDRFAELVAQLLERKIEFKLILLGQQFDSEHPALNRIKHIAYKQLLHVGHVATQQEYGSWLQQMDCVVSTADHEFFGIGVIEAMLAGAYPLLPNRLAYPEILRTTQMDESQLQERFLYASEADLLEKLVLLAKSKREGTLSKAPMQDRHLFSWENSATKLDTEIEKLCELGRNA